MNKRKIIILLILAMARPRTFTISQDRDETKGIDIILAVEGIIAGGGAGIASGLATVVAGCSVAAVIAAGNKYGGQHHNGQQ